MLPAKKSRKSPLLLSEVSKTSEPRTSRRIKKYTGSWLIALAMTKLATHAADSAAGRRAGRSSASLYDRSLMQYGRYSGIEKATRLFLLRPSPVTKMSILLCGTAPQRLRNPSLFLDLGLFQIEVLARESWKRKRGLNYLYEVEGRVSLVEIECCPVNMRERFHAVDQKMAVPALDLYVVVGLS